MGAVFYCLRLASASLVTTKNRAMRWLVCRGFDSVCPVGPLAGRYLEIIDTSRRDDLLDATNR